MLLLQLINQILAVKLAVERFAQIRKMRLNYRNNRIVIPAQIIWNL